MDQYIRAIESEFIREDLPEVRPGYTVRVHVRIKEGKRERLQAYEGIVIRVKGSGVGKTFTVRRIGSAGIGVERIFPYASPHVEKIQILRKAKVRRAKLYYLRNVKGKIKLKEKKDKKRG